MIDTLTSQGRGLEGDSFAVSEDWTVTDTYDYEAGQQANEAATATTTLQRLADELGQADQDTADAVKNATADMGAAAPVVDGLAGDQQAKDDLASAQNGTATPEQLTRLKRRRH